MSVSVITPFTQVSGVDLGSFISSGGGIEVREYTVTAPTPADINQWDQIVVFFSSSAMASNFTFPAGDLGGIPLVASGGGTLTGSTISGGSGASSFSGKIATVSQLYWNNSPDVIPAGTVVTIKARCSFPSSGLTNTIREIMYAFEGYHLHGAGRLIGSNTSPGGGSQSNLTFASLAFLYGGNVGCGVNGPSSWPTYLMCVAWDSDGGEAVTPSGGNTLQDNLRTSTGRTFQGDLAVPTSSDNRARDLATRVESFQATVIGSDSIAVGIGPPKLGNLTSFSCVSLAFGPPPAGLQPDLIRNAEGGYVLHYIDLEGQLKVQHYGPDDALLSEDVVDAGPHCSCPSFCLREGVILGTYLVDQDGLFAFSFDGGYTYSTFPVPGSWDRLFSKEQDGRIVCMGWREVGVGTGLGDWTVLAGDVYRDETTGDVQVTWGTEGAIVSDATNKGRMPEVVSGQPLLLYQDQFGVWQLRYTRNLALDGSADWIDFTSLPNPVSGLWSEVSVQLYRNRMVAEACVEGDHSATQTEWFSITGEITDAATIVWGSPSLLHVVGGLDLYPYGHLRAPYDLDLNFVHSHSDATWRIITSRNMNLAGAANWF